MFLRLATEYMMPQYNLGEVISSATRNIGRRDDISTSDASFCANRAYFEVFYATEPEEGERIAVSSTTSGENKIELPSDFYEAISATIIYRPSWSTSSSVQSSYNTMKVVGMEAMDGRNPVPGGVPNEIAFFNSWLEMYPSPNSGYSFQLRYRAHPTDLTSLSSVPSLSTPWRAAWMLKTQEYLADFLQDEAQSQKAHAQYLAYVATLKTPAAVRNSGEFRRSFKPYVSVGGRRRV